MATLIAGESFFGPIDPGGLTVEDGAAMVVVIWCRIGNDEYQMVDVVDVLPGAGVRAACSRDQIAAWSARCSGALTADYRQYPAANGNTSQERRDLIARVRDLYS